jgi:hypothetical protein
VLIGDLTWARKVSRGLCVCDSNNASFVERTASGELETSSSAMARAVDRTSEVGTTLLTLNHRHPGQETV